jgi:hypothetical protein
MESEMEHIGTLQSAYTLLYELRKSRFGEPGGAR